MDLLDIFIFASCGFVVIYLSALLNALLRLPDFNSIWEKAAIIIGHGITWLFIFYPYLKTYLHQ